MPTEGLSLWGAGTREDPFFFLSFCLVLQRRPHPPEQAGQMCGWMSPLALSYTRAFPV